MTPTDKVIEEYDFPFALRRYQLDEVNSLAMSSTAGYYWEPGTGKTAGTTHHMLYRSMAAGVECWILLMPPILLRQWSNWLSSIKRKGGTGFAPLIYRGTPKQRLVLDLHNPFVLMSYQIFKLDFVRLWDHYEGKNVGGLADEAHALKNHQSITHKAYYQFFENREHVLLTGTPITKPGDAYAYCRLVAPGRYRNRRHFEQLHVGATDQYSNPAYWVNLDVLAESMQINTSRILLHEVNLQLPSVQYTPIVYELDPAHKKLYDRIAQERLVEFESDSVINAISEGAMYSALQQIIVNWGHFAEDPTKRPAIFDLIDEIFEEIGPTKKLVIAAHFVRTNTLLLQELENKYGAVAVFGGVTAASRENAIKTFIEDPNCRCLILQPTSAGFGVDGLQLVCHNMLVVEAPATAPPFHQVVARLDRDGQTVSVNCRVAIAAKTVQVRMFNTLLSNDSQINQVQRGYRDLKEIVFGDGT